MATCPPPPIRARAHSPELSAGRLSPPPPLKGPGPGCHLAVAHAACLVAVWVEAFADVTVARAARGVSPPATGARLVNPAERGPGGHELPPPHPVCCSHVQPSSRYSEGHPRDRLLRALVHLPGLTIWPKVILETLAGVAVGGAGLSDTHRLMLTWVQVTHVSTVVTIVTWDRKDERGSIPTLPWHFL